MNCHLYQNNPLFILLILACRLLLFCVPLVFATPPTPTPPTPALVLFITAVIITVIPLITAIIICNYSQWAPEIFLGDLFVQLMELALAFMLIYQQELKPILIFSSLNFLSLLIISIALVVSSCLPLWSSA